MNHVPSHILAEQARPLSRRAISKLRTRQALIAAAKSLFTSRGYEEATVRDIARDTGMSTGAVFANFNDKADLFAEVLSTDLKALNTAMTEAAEQVKTARTSEVLLAIFARGYAFHLPQLALLQSAQAVGWTRTPIPRRSEDDVAKSLVVATLRQGVYRGELADTFDVDLASDLLWDAYISNYRLAAFEGATESALNSRISGQITLVLSAGRK